MYFSMNARKRWTIILGIKIKILLIQSFTFVILAILVGWIRQVASLILGAAVAHFWTFGGATTWRWGRRWRARAAVVTGEDWVINIVHFRLETYLVKDSLPSVAYVKVDEHGLLLGVDVFKVFKDVGYEVHIFYFVLLHHWQRILWRFGHNNRFSFFSFIQNSPDPMIEGSLIIIFQSIRQ